MIRTSIALYRNAYSGISPSVWWLSLVMFVNRSGTMVIPFLTVYMKKELHFTITQAGLVMGMFGVGALLGGYLGGRLTDKVGFYPVQFWSLFLHGVLFIVLSQMKTFWEVGGCIFLLSTIGESFRPANSAAIAYYSQPESRTRSYSLNRLAINLGFSIGPAIGGILAAISYQWLFWADGITCIFAVLLLRALLPPVKNITPAHAEVKKGDPSTSAYHDRVYMLFMFYVFLVAFCFLLMFSIVPLYYAQQVKLSESTIGILLASNGLLIAIVEMVMVYKLEGKRTATYYVSLGALLIGFSYLVLNLEQSLIIVALGMLILTVGEMLMFPFINTFWVGRSKDHNRGQYAAVFTMSFALAHIAAPTLGAYIADHFGYHTLWYIVFLICLIASIGFYKIKT